MKLENEYIFGDEWGITYDPNTKTMLGGYSLDGETFRPEFKITEAEEDDIANAMSICIALSSDYGTITAPYGELVTEYNDRC